MKHKRRIYLIISILILVIEVLIETQCKGGFIRYYLGDYIMVIGIYTMIKTLKPTCNSIKLAISILIFSFGVEFLQWINILEVLGINRSRTTDIIIGSTFSTTDLICYALGVLSVYTIDQFYTNKILREE